MRGLRQEPMSEKQFNEMEGISTEPIIPPLTIRPKKDARPISATMENHTKVEG